MALTWNAGALHLFAYLLQGASKWRSVLEGGILVRFSNALIDNAIVYLFVTQRFLAERMKPRATSGLAIGKWFFTENTRCTVFPTICAFVRPFAHRSTQNK
jgi:hypothetical protein